MNELIGTVIEDLGAQRITVEQAKQRVDAIVRATRPALLPRRHAFAAMPAGCCGCGLQDWLDEDEDARAARRIH